MRRGQFYIIAAVMIILSLMLLNQYVRRTEFSPARPEVSVAASAEENEFIMGSIANASSYLLKRDLMMVQKVLEGKSGWEFEEKVDCCWMFRINSTHKAYQCSTDCYSAGISDFSNMTVYIVVGTGGQKSRYKTILDTPAASDR